MPECLELPEFPELPDISPLTIPLPTLPTIDLSIDYCCRLAFAFEPEIPQEVKDAIKAALLLVPNVSPTIAAINAQIARLNAYVDSIPLRCPFDDQATE